MHKLSVSFALFTIAGYWRPEEWPVHSFRYWLYNVYSALMILSLYFYTFCYFIDCMIIEDIESATIQFSVFISVAGVCAKVANLFFQRGKIINTVNTLVQGNCLPRDEIERIIQRKFDDYARNLTVWCEILNELAAVFASLTQFKELLRTRKLPNFDWSPFNLASQKAYVFSLIHHTLTLMVCANTSVANETLISGLMIQVCSQFEIFCHRARNLPSALLEAERICTSMQDLRNRRMRILGDLVRYHRIDYKLARVVNKIFQYMIFLQFYISSIVLCLIIYVLSTKSTLNTELIWSISYLGSMLMQVYLYCWFGNEVTLKSTSVGDAIYEMDWTTLPTSVMRDLLTIMARTKKPVVMSSGHVVSLSTESFMAIIKMSYSSYNLLKDSS
ncbi:odorant receptor 67c-like [Hylaeus anthracinus]|uniref:odorant receptor 67c-like n=1 Tax=Hylaeus anthracinus TaxID=313031 RepID=UPI0023B9502D|nr:odorant receptor 67c-like [Hylaeus anthracinus]